MKRMFRSIHVTMVDVNMVATYVGADLNISAHKSTVEFGSAGSIGGNVWLLLPKPK